MKKAIYITCILLSVTLVKAQQQKEMSLSMQEAINYAIKNNYNNKVALNDIKAAKKRKWETTATGLPQINGSIDYNNSLKQPVSLLPAEITGGEPGTFTPVTFGTKQTINASATLSQLLFDGSYLVGLQAAKTYLKISEQSKEKTEIATREAIINAYGNVLVSEKSVEILENNKKVLEKNLNDTEKIYENGLNEEEDVEQLKVTLGTIENALRNTIRLKDIAYQMLNLALGNPINTKLHLTDTLDGLKNEYTNLSLLTKPFKIENHIDFKIAENDLESKRLLMLVEKSKALPRLSAFLNYGTAANANSFYFFNHKQDWFQSSILGVSLQVPIFSSLGRSARTAQAKIALESANVRLEETVERLNLAAQTARSNYQLSIENYQTAEKNLNLAERIEKKQQIKFFEGVSSSFELSQAQNQLYTQQNNYINAILNVIANKAKLETALNIPIQ
ncbi:TolC family protein [Tenacibaculum sp. UWU-22]|uniref:TolC family protein n=1 Tax=Tenacibaculum sp. UWU-22 TaxID=3234187 RepID=UPI0034DAC4ED